MQDILSNPFFLPALTLLGGLIVLFRVGVLYWVVAIVMVGFGAYGIADGLGYGGAINDAVAGVLGGESE
ncbi:MAG: hypothetical protein AAGM38_13685 [Pseudomonadota bacterium]